MPIYRFVWIYRFATKANYVELQSLAYMLNCIVKIP